MPCDTLGRPPFRKFWTLAFSMAVAALTLAAMPAVPAWADTAGNTAGTTATTSTADTISGTPTVIDADIISFGMQRVILWGIDAPEKRQTCQANGELWGCYQAAFRYLQLLTGRGKVTCQLKGKPDPFGRRYGVCESGGQDLNAAMVKAGMALAYNKQTDVYDPEMAAAIAAGVGLWQPGVQFEEPWVFRHRNTPGGYR